MSTTSRRLLAGFVVAMAHAPAAPAQTPQGTAFTYQGRLTQAGAPASGAYDLRFVLYDAPTGGTQAGPTVALEDVTVTEGLFTVPLDFGNVFVGQKRWLELAVRPGSGTGAHTVIVPRQELAPTPSALFTRTAADALGLGGVPASQFVQTNDPRLSDPRVPLPGSPNYVQNGTTPQPGVSFNVAGTGAANVLSATTQFNLGASRILAASGTDNLFAGIAAGAFNTGTHNTFFGHRAGEANTTGTVNAFFGATAGLSNTTASNNAFFGALAGRASTGAQNAFFGALAGTSNTTGISNAFFGHLAGSGNSTGQQNAIFGEAAGVTNNGSFNSFFGQVAGNNNTTGGNNTFVGWGAGGNSRIGFGNTFIGSQSTLETFDTGSSNNTLLGSNTRVAPNLSNATALGTRAYVAQNNALILGGIAGVNGAVSHTNIGIGTTTPAARLHVVDGTSMLFGASFACANVGIAFASSIANLCQNFSLYGGDGNTYVNRPTGGFLFFRENNVTQVAIRSGGVLNLQVLGTAGTTTLCRNGTNDVSTCSSSLRYKDDVASFHGGLDIVDRLRPISFTWKATGQPDIGLAAEEVAEVEPLLAFRNDKGEIEGVNYPQLTVVLVNALRQQEARLRREIEALKALVCAANPRSAPCVEGAPAP